MTTIELTEEEAAILRELIAERKEAKAHWQLIQSFAPKVCRHGVLYGELCVDCEYK